MTSVKAERALFIKLGEGGMWESGCLRDGNLRFGYSRFYFVTHSPNGALRTEAAAADDLDFILWDVGHLASQAVRGGLTGWLLDKAS